MKTFVMAAMAAAFMIAGATSASAMIEINKSTVEVGKPAPAFTGTDTNGKTINLSDYAGKTVVLEWTNPKCPFVEKHYGSGNMQALQKKYTAQGVVWLSVNSSAAGKEGNMSAADANQVISEVGAAPTAYILDPTGEIGHLYDARTTPDMFVINGEGTLVYAGAIDSNDSFKPETIEGATNYVAAALDALAAGKPIETAQTKPYGCGVKY
jgi:hypothetical protein